MDKTNIIYEGNFAFDTDRNEITAYLGIDNKSITIPEMIGGNKVKRLADLLFYDFTELESVTIPDSVTAFGLPIDYVYPDRLPISKDEPKYGVFDGCTNFQSISYKGKTYDREHIDKLYKAVNG